MHARTRPGPPAADPFAAVALPLLDVVHDVALVLTDDQAAAAWLTEATFAGGRDSFAAIDPGVSARAWLLRVTYGLWRRHFQHLGQWLVELAGDGALVEPVVELGPDGDGGRAGGPDPAAVASGALATTGPQESPESPESLVAVSWHALRLLEEGDRLRRALVRLPESFRVAVALVDVHGFTCAEAATVTSTPRAVVLSRLHRARACLRVVAAPGQEAVGADAL
jgi:DNA-directed RNA polymerase specialized sigma24 family protein